MINFFKDLKHNFMFITILSSITFFLSVSNSWAYLYCVCEGSGLCFPDGKFSTNGPVFSTTCDDDDFCDNVCMNNGYPYCWEEHIDCRPVGPECLIDVIYGEESEQAKRAKYFRDNILNQIPVGQEIIRLYYQWSPAIVKAMEEDEEFKQDVKEVVDGILTSIEQTVE